MAHFRLRLAVLAVVVTGAVALLQPMSQVAAVATPRTVTITLAGTKLGGVALEVNQYQGRALGAVLPPLERLLGKPRLLKSTFEFCGGKNALRVYSWVDLSLAFAAPSSPTHGDWMMLVYESGGWPTFVRHGYHLVGGHLRPVIVSSSGKRFGPKVLSVNC
jgi:hypothetical protein